MKSTRQMRAQVDTTQRKNKNKQSTKNKEKTLCKWSPWLLNDNQQ